MTRHTLNLASGIAMLALLAGSAACSSSAPPAEPAAEGAAEPAAPAAAPVAAPDLGPSPQLKFVTPVRGEAAIGYLAPVIKRDKGVVMTSITIKNLSTAHIAGLRVDEYWYDRGGNALPSDTERVQRPIAPGEVITVLLETPYTAQMDRNSYQFSHANGTVKATQMKTLE
jgi:hypothetical protein